jgi:hypothetical protein
MSDIPDALPDPHVDATEPARSYEEPPSQVVMAIRLAAINYGLGFLSLFVFRDYFLTLQSPGSLIVNQLLGLALSIWIYYKIYKGRNWARITLLVLCVLGGLMTLSRVFMEKFAELIAPAPELAKVQMIVGMTISLFILWLLFVSPGRRWFRRVPAGPAA